ncbi:hypothetical protein ACG2F4_09295 [Halalkalibaculum sp. DA3122]
MPDYQQFFTLIGQLDTETELELSYMPLFRKKRRVNFEKIMATESDMHAVLLDREGEPVLRVPLSYGYYCTDPGRLSKLAVRGYIPFDERTQGIRYEYKGKLLDELRVPESRPELTITTKIPERITDERFLLEWKTSYDGDAPLQYKVLYTNNGGETWQRVGNRTEKNRMQIEVTELAGGDDCLFLVQVTDGYNNAEAESDKTKIDRKPHEVTILSPVEGESLSTGRSVLFNGQAYNPNTREEITEGFTWLSSADGELGEGALLQTRLSEGPHTITLQVGKSTSSIRVQVE